MRWPWRPSSNSSFSTAIASLDALSSSTFQLLLLEDVQASQWSKRVVEVVALLSCIGGRGGGGVGAATRSLLFLLE
jgi:hypothetical protein